MLLERAEYAGFCYGVRRALDLVERELENKKEQQVSILGPLIHNTQVNQKLRESGLQIIEEMAQAKSGVFIIPSHGLSRSKIEQAREKGLKICDATCPHVRKVQNLAQRLAQEGYQVLIVGDAHHSEVKGIKGWVEAENTIVVGKPDDLAQMTIASRVGIVVQTTQTAKHLGEMIAAITPRVKEMKIYNTICLATRQRQEAAEKLAQTVDVMLVVGGKNSANTMRLTELCRQSLVTVYHVEVADDVQREWFIKKQKIGITAGASTPSYLIQEIEDKIKAF